MLLLPSIIADEVLPPTQCTQSFQANHLVLRHFQEAKNSAGDRTAQLLDGAGVIPRLLQL